MTYIIVFAVMFVVVSVILVLNVKTTNDLEILDENCRNAEYSQTTFETHCELSITFNMEVKSGYVCVKFYDQSKSLLQTKLCYCISYGNYVENMNIWVDGRVNSYEIAYLDIDPTNNFWVNDMLYSINFIVLMCLISACFLSYKEYDVNGNNVIVYAGFYNNYIKINGEIYDEYKTLVSMTPIYLDCQLDEDFIEVTISLSNRITTKVNGKLIYPL